MEPNTYIRQEARRLADSLKYLGGIKGFKGGEHSIPSVEGWFILVDGKAEYKTLVYRRDGKNLKWEP